MSYTEQFENDNGVFFIYNGNRLGYERHEIRKLVAELNKHIERWDSENKCHLVSAGKELVAFARKRSEDETNKLIQLSLKQDEKKRKLCKRIIDAICKFAVKLGW